MYSISTSCCCICRDVHSHVMMWLANQLWPRQTRSWLVCKSNCFWTDTSTGCALAPGSCSLRPLLNKRVFQNISYFLSWMESKTSVQAKAFPSDQKAAATTACSQSQSGTRGTRFLANVIASVLDETWTLLSSGSGLSCKPCVDLGLSAFRRWGCVVPLSSSPWFGAWHCPAH